MSLHGVVLSQLKGSEIGADAMAINGQVPLCRFHRGVELSMFIKRNGVEHGEVGRIMGVPSWRQDEIMLARVPFILGG